jgi:hypothetical protein
VTLLGPQRRPTVGRVVQSLGLAPPIATVTAGWQEREGDDAELDDLLGGGTRNLRLYQRWADVQECDPDLANAMRRRRDALAELRETYLLRLRQGLAAVDALAPDTGDAPAPVLVDPSARTLIGAVEAGSGAAVRSAARAEARVRAIEDVRRLDAELVERLDEFNQAFVDRWRLPERECVARHRAEIADALAGANAVAWAGGHVGVLVALVHLFAVKLPATLPIVAWSAGAMVLTERVVLFHDRTATGASDPEVYGRGLGVLTDLVVLPHARTRLLITNAARMSVLTARFRPASCLLLDEGARVDLDADGGVPTGAPVLAAASAA